LLCIAIIRVFDSLLTVVCLLIRSWFDAGGCESDSLELDRFRRD
jgi:hypothetical protein